MNGAPIYLDHNATTPCDEAVVEAMLPYFSTGFGNAASRQHAYGRDAAAAVELAREQVAGLIGAESNEIIFTSGATEAVNLALKGVFESYRSKGNHIITCKTEHRAVLDTCAHLEKLGAELSYLDVGPDGLLNLDEFEAAFKSSTILVAIMYANNETGVIQQIEKIAELSKRYNAVFFSDATQAVGKMAVNVNREGIDLLCLSAHKLYGPKGTGALYVRRKNPRVRLQAQQHGGGHEKGLRSGTLNVPGIVGLGRAAELSRQLMKEEASHLLTLRDNLEAGLLSMEAVQVNGSTVQRLPHVSNMCFHGADAEALMMNFSQGLAVSSGSACTSGSLEPSHVLQAMGLSREMAKCSLRFSLGRATTAEQVRDAVYLVTRAVNEVREANPFWTEHKKELAGMSRIQ